MTETNFSAIRARLRYESIEEFTEGYARFISAGGMFIPMAPAKLKPIGTTVRFQFLLSDGTTALLGEGIVVQVREADPANSRAPVGMLVKFSKLSQESKNLVDEVIARKAVGDFAAHDPDSFEESEPQEEPDAGPDTVEAADQPEDPTFETSLENLYETERQKSEADSLVTREAPSADELDDEEDEPEPEEVKTTGPRKLAQTEGGLQILAFDDISDEEAERMSLDLGDEDDFDEMFDGLFGGDDDADDDAIFGDMFGGGGGGDDMFGGGDGMFGEAEPGPEAEEEAAVEEESDPEEEDELPEPDEASEPVDEEPESLLEVPLEEISEPESEPDLAEESAPDVPEVEDTPEGSSEPADEGYEESEPSFEDQLGQIDDLLDESDASDEEADFEDVPVLDPGDQFEDSEIEDSEQEEPSDVSPEDAVIAEALLASESGEIQMPSDAEDDPYEFDVVSKPQHTMEVDDALIEEVVEAEEPHDFDADEPDEELLALESSAVELIEGSDAEDLLMEEDEEDEAPLQVEDEGPSELENLLGNLESDPEEPDLSSLTLASSPEIRVDDAPPPPQPEEEDEESLEFLLAAAKNEIQEKHGDDSSSSDKDILDELLGDDAGLPPPPPDKPVFQPTPPTDKGQKKGGFLSKLFGKD